MEVLDLCCNHQPALLGWAIESSVTQWGGAGVNQETRDKTFNFLYVGRFDKIDVVSA